MPNESTARPQMDADEKAKLERRVVSAIKSGKCMADLAKRFGSEALVRNVAKANGLTIAKGMGRRW